MNREKRRRLVLVSIIIIIRIEKVVLTRTDIVPEVLIHPIDQEGVEPQHVVGVARPLLVSLSNTIASLTLTVQTLYLLKRLLRRKWSRR
jgi:hypothetical protein